VCILRPDTATRLGLSVPTDAPLLGVLALAGHVSAPLVPLPPLRVGDYVLEHLTAAIAPIPELPIPVDGILGANFIELFRMTVDYRGKQLYLELSR